MHKKAVRHDTILHFVVEVCNEEACKPDEINEADEVYESGISIASATASCRQLWHSATILRPSEGSLPVTPLLIVILIRLLGEPPSPSPTL
jgi:hypothetical protein